MNFRVEFAEFVVAKNRIADIVDGDEFQTELHAYADFMLNAHAYDFMTDRVFNVSHGFGAHPAVLKFGHWTLEQEYSDASTIVVQQCVGLEVEVVGVPVAWFFDRESFCADVRQDMKGHWDEPDVIHRAEEFSE